MTGLELFRSLRSGLAASRRRGVEASLPLLSGGPLGRGAALVWQPSGLRAAHSLWWLRGRFNRPLRLDANCTILELDEIPFLSRW